MNRTHRLRSLVALLIAVGSISAQADVTDEWTAIAANLAQEARQSPQTAADNLRAMQEAVAAAAAAAKNAHNVRNESPRVAAERHDAAVMIAAFAVLEHLYPNQREGLEASLAVSFSHIPESAAKADGAAIGRMVANAMLAADELAAAKR